MDLHWSRSVLLCSSPIATLEVSNGTRTHTDTSGQLQRSHIILYYCGCHKLELLWGCTEGHSYSNKSYCTMQRNEMDLDQVNSLSRNKPVELNIAIAIYFSGGGGSHFSRFSRYVMLFFNGRNFHFGRPKKKKSPLLIFVPFPFQFSFSSPFPFFSYRLISRLVSKNFLGVLTVLCPLPRLLRHWHCPCYGAIYKVYIAGQSSVSPLLFTRTQNARELRAINPQFSQNSFCDYSVSGKMNYEDYFWQTVFKNNPCMQKKSNLTPDESMRALNLQFILTPCTNSSFLNKSFSFKSHYPD